VYRKAQKRTAVEDGAVPVGQVLQPDKWTMRTV